MGGRTIVRHLIPNLCVSQNVDEGVCNLLGVGGVHHQAMVQRRHDIHRTAILCCHCGHTMRRCLKVHHRI